MMMNDDHLFKSFIFQKFEKVFSNLFLSIIFLRISFSRFHLHQNIYKRVNDYDGKSIISFLVVKYFLFFISYIFFVNQFLRWKSIQFVTFKKKILKTKLYSVVKWNIFLAIKRIIFYIFVRINSDLSDSQWCDVMWVNSKSDSQTSHLIYSDVTICFVWWYF